jgi:hypothetical protein
VPFRGKGNIFQDDRLIFTMFADIFQAEIRFQRGRGIRKRKQNDTKKLQTGKSVQKGHGKSRKFHGSACYFDEIVVVSYMYNYM